MSTIKYISYLLCNKGIIVNLYKLHFLSSHFSFQPNKRVFHSPTFPPFQPNTHKRKPKLFYPLDFPFSHFSTSPTKQSLRLRLVGGVENWDGGKLWEDRKVEGWKIFSFPSCVFGWRGRKVKGWKTLLFGLREKGNDENFNLYKLTIIPLLHNK